VAIDPKDLGELQKALNEAAGKASVLWTTFITFQLYLAIAFGSVTHRDHFLENSIKLPLLNIDLPLVGFFLVAPAVLVILHFYVFLQLLGLATTAKDYSALLAIDVPDVSDRQYVRRRLDVFPILRFLAGPRDQSVSRCIYRGQGQPRHKVQRTHGRRWPDRLRPCLQAWPRRYRVEAQGFRLPFRSVGRLAQNEELGCTGREAGGRGGLEQMTLKQEALGKTQRSPGPGDPSEGRGIPE
jgi:hypothetical protein